jgi:hypothetical protein
VDRKPRIKTNTRARAASRHPNTQLHEAQLSVRRKAPACTPGIAIGSFWGERATVLLVLLLLLLLLLLPGASGSFSRS